MSSGLEGAIPATVSASSRYPLREDDRVAALVDRLLTASPEFAAWWPRHDVAGFETHRRVFDHPRAGRLELEQQQLVPAGQPDLRVVAHLPLTGDDSVDRLVRDGSG